MAKCRNRKRPVLAFPPDPNEVTRATLPARKDTKRWCKGIVGREHHYVESLSAALAYAEKQTGLLNGLEGSYYYGMDWYGQSEWTISPTCENCGKTDWRGWRRRIWCTLREYMDIPYHAARFSKWDRYYAGRLKY